jgi:uncharacterized protein
MTSSGTTSDILREHNIAALPTDHAGMAVLPFELCRHLVAREPVGRVAFIMAGETVIFPVNHVVDGLAVAFRTTGGSKLTAAHEAALVTFEVDGYDETTRDGWSVVVSGRAEAVTDPATLQRLEDTGLHGWTSSTEPSQWVLIHPNSMTGRAIIRR